MAKWWMNDRLQILLQELDSTLPFVRDEFFMPNTYSESTGTSNLQVQNDQGVRKSHKRT
jgi:hypothetical protein